MIAAIKTDRPLIKTEAVGAVTSDESKTVGTTLITARMNRTVHKRSETASARTANSAAF